MRMQLFGGDAHLPRAEAPGEAIQECLDPLPPASAAAAASASRSESERDSKSESESECSIANESDGAAPRCSGGRRRGPWRDQARA